MSDEKKEEAAEAIPAEGSATKAVAPEAAAPPKATQSEKASAEAPRPRSGSSGGDRAGGDRAGGDRRGGDSSGGPPSRGGRGKGRGGRFRRGRRHCLFCADKELQIDYKFVDVLEEFVSERGKIVPRRSTGTCAKHQRPLALSIKRARNAALLSYTGSGLQQ